MLTMKAFIIKSLHLVKDRSGAYKKKRNVMGDGHGNDFEVTGSGSGLPSAALTLRGSVSLSSAVVFEAAAMVILLQVLLATLASVASSPTVYDQRQTGKTNVRVELRDAVIVAIGDGELGGDYDYHYDYSDLTIKPSQPISSTTPIPTTSAETPSKSTTPKVTATSTTTVAGFNITQNAAVVLEAENNSIIFPANVKPASATGETIKIPASSGYGPDQIPVLVLQEVHRPNKFLPVKTVEKEDASSQKPDNEAVITPKKLPTRNCAPGFSLDNQNRCKRIRRPTRAGPQLPTGLRFDHGLVTRS